MLALQTMNWVDALARKDIQVEYWWVPAHKGIDANEEVDQQATEAAYKYCGRFTETQELLPFFDYVSFISKNHFRPGGMVPSEWTRYIRAVRGTPVADYSVPGTNTTCRVAYRPPIAVSPFLLTLSVFYCKRTLWCCGQQ